MKLSRRDVSKFSNIKENLENIGTTNVTIEPPNQYTSKAVDILKKDAPEVLKDITNIRTDLQKDVYGEYNSAYVHTVFLNTVKIERDVKSKVSGNTEEEIIRQNAIIISHESGHQHSYTQTKDTSEAPAEQREREITERIDRD